MCPNWVVQLFVRIFSGWWLHPSLVSVFSLSLCFLWELGFFFLVNSARVLPRCLGPVLDLSLTETFFFFGSLDSRALVVSTDWCGEVFQPLLVFSSFNCLALSFSFSHFTSNASGDSSGSMRWAVFTHLVFGPVVSPALYFLLSLQFEKFGIS
jgi:hypothetical protein